MEQDAVITFPGRAFMLSPVFTSDFQNAESLVAMGIGAPAMECFPETANAAGKGQDVSR